MRWREELLDEALERLDDGEAMVAVLDGRPQGEELRPLLELALQLRAVAPRRPEPAFRAAARQRLERVVVTRRQPVVLSIRPWLARAAAAVLAVAFVATGAVGVAGASLPDSPIYPVKLAVEQAQLLLTRDAVANDGLQTDFAERRLAELEALSERAADFRQLRAATERAVAATAALPAAAQSGLWPRLADLTERQQNAFLKRKERADGNATDAARLFALSMLIYERANESNPGPEGEAVETPGKSGQAKGVGGGQDKGRETPSGEDGAAGTLDQPGKRAAAPADDEEKDGRANQPRSSQQSATGEAEGQAEGRWDGETGADGRGKGQRFGVIGGNAGNQRDPASGQTKEGKGGKGQGSGTSRR